MKEKKRRNILEIFNKDKHTRTMGVMIILAMGAILWQEIDYLIPRTVIVQYAGLDGAVQEVEIQTRANTVEEALVETGMEIQTIDAVLPCREYGVSNGLTVEVKECLETTAVIAGSKKDITLMSGTVAENLALNEIEYDEDDIITPDLESSVTTKTKIEVKEVHTESEEKTIQVKAENKVILDPSVTSGVISETEGHDGEGIYTISTTYVNGKKTKTKKTLKKWVTEPEDHVLRFGTASTGESGEMSYSETFTAETTAYTAASGARGSTGQLVHVGTCAVDPSVIPYGTTLYVEDYGIAVANDTGGAVNGYIIDLYMNSKSACISWGRRSKTVYVLD